MLPEDKYFSTLTDDELWRRYCGFFDFSVDEFMEIQEHLLVEQIALAAESPLGKRIMQGNRPKSVDEFRQLVPLTIYSDYEPDLGDCWNDGLAVKPAVWCHSTGRGGRFKWIPYTADAMEVCSRLFVGYLILATADRKGEIKIKPGERVMMHIPPRPYASWTFCYYASQAFSLLLIPSLEKAEGLGFRERVQEGFREAMRSGVDEIASISSVMVKVGERMAEQAQGMKLSIKLLEPRIMMRLGRAWLRSKLQGRPMLPKDIWHPKAIITGGVDTRIYKDDVVRYWGKVPFEMYGSSEVGTIAVQNWNKKGLTFIPYSAFWEFIPEEDSIRSREDKSYQPRTVLINQLEKGMVYEVVLSQFHGMPLMRYRIGDMVKVVAMSDDEAGVNLPQVQFHARVGEVIELAGLARLTETTIWEALASSGLKYEDWSARKEYEQSKTFLRIYLELKEQGQPSDIAHLIDERLMAADIDYRDIGQYLELQPVKVTLLPPGTFERYYQQKVKEGADLAHLKPPHMNAADAVIQRLLQLSGRPEEQ